MPDPDVPAPGTDDTPADPVSPAALGELRTAVHRAAGEIERLRTKAQQLSEENEQLRQRVTELEEDPGAGRDGTALLLDEEPDTLRQRIDRFIEAIDAHLNEESEDA